MTSMRMAEWIHKQMNSEYKATPDDVYDVLLGNITTPYDLVSEVEYWAVEYNEIRRANAR